MKERRIIEENEVSKLQGKKEALEKKVRYLSDERGIEAEMRRQFDVALPNEQVVVIVEPEKDETNTASSTYKENEEAPHNTALTEAFTIVMTNGLRLLGIKVPKRM